MTNQEVLTRITGLYEELLAHEGFGEILIEMKMLRKGQKEVIVHCGKQHRYVVDYTKDKPPRGGRWKVVRNEELPST